MSVFVVVPVEPHLGMCSAGRNAANLPLIATARECIAAAIAARPTGPEVPKLLVQRTEAEWRDEFDRVFGIHDATDYQQHIRVIKTQTWLAALRFVGAIKEDVT